MTVAVYESTRTFPREELYGLISQMRRAACSVPANVVEGAPRETKRDYLHFLYIARASLNETHYFIHLARRLGYLRSNAANRLIAETNRTFACLHGLIRAVEKESGRLSKAIAVCTSAFFLAIVRILP